MSNRVAAVGSAPSSEQSESVPGRRASRLIDRQKLTDVQPIDSKELHTNWFQHRYATSSTAFWLANFSFTQQDTLYNIGFNTDSATTACIIIQPSPLHIMRLLRPIRASVSLVTTSMQLVFYLISGQLQDHELLSSCFPIPNWGRRAPFFLTHLAPLGLFIFLLYNPPVPTVCSCDGIDVPCVVGTRAAAPSGAYSNASETADMAGCDSGSASCPVVRGCSDPQSCFLCDDQWLCSENCTAGAKDDDEQSAVSADDNGEVTTDGNVGVCPDGTKQATRFDRRFLMVWSLVLQLLGIWCGVGMRVAMDSSLYEVFPFQEERMKMNGLLTYWYVFSFVGLIVASLPISIIYGMEGMKVWDGRTLWFGGVALVWSFTSFFAVEPMKDADQTVKSLDQSPIRSWFEVLRSANFQWLVAIQCMQACIGGTQTIFGLYYLIFVGQFSTSMAGMLQIVYVVLGIGVQVLTVPFWVKKFSTKDPTWYAKAGMLAHAVLAPVIYLVGSALNPAATWICEFFIYSLLNSPRPYWKVMALGHFIDEDCHTLKGERREGTITSLFNILNAAAQTIFPQLLALGMAASGIDTTIQDDPTTPCVNEAIMDQPDSGKRYLLGLYAGLIPGFNLMQLMLLCLYEKYYHRKDKVEKIRQNQLETFVLPSTSTLSAQRISLPSGAASVE